MYDPHFDDFHVMRCNHSDVPQTLSVKSIVSLTRSRRLTNRSEPQSVNVGAVELMCTCVTSFLQILTVCRLCMHS